MKIDIILPYKEIFSEDSASAVSLTVKNSMEFTKFKKEINIYGQFTKNPFYKSNFVGIKTNKLIHFSNNFSIIKNYLKLSKLHNNNLIEIHNRPYLFNYLVKKINNKPIILYYHNDPTMMKGSKTIKERLNIINKSAGVICVSEFIKKKFLLGIKKNYSNIYVLPNGIKRNLTKLPKKQKIVLFVGRLVEEKGAHLYVAAIKNLFKEFPKWQFIIIGTSKAGQKKLISQYEKNIVNSFLEIGKQAKYFGFLSNTKVKSIMNISSILTVPSIWNEPFALTALEGLASGQAVIASKKGGLAEMLKDSGILINQINSKKLETSLRNLMNNNKKMLYYQNKAWKNFKYHQIKVSKKQDQYRTKIFKNFNSHNLNNY